MDRIRQDAVEGLLCDLVCASALKWGFADFEDWNVAVDRKTLKPEDTAKVMQLLKFRPIQFCMFLKALVGTEEMERLMNQGISVAKEG